MKQKTFLSPNFPKIEDFDNAVAEYASQMEDEGFDVEIYHSFAGNAFLAPVNAQKILPTDRNLQAVAVNLQLAMMVCVTVVAFDAEENVPVSSIPDFDNPEHKG